MTFSVQSPDGSASSSECGEWIESQWKVKPIVDMQQPQLDLSSIGFILIWIYPRLGGHKCLLVANSSIPMPRKGPSAPVCRRTSIRSHLTHVRTSDSTLAAPSSKNRHRAQAAPGAPRGPRTSLSYQSGAAGGPSGGAGAVRGPSERKKGGKARKKKKKKPQQRDAPASEEEVARHVQSALSDLPEFAREDEEEDDDEDEPCVLPGGAGGGGAGASVTESCRRLDRHPSLVLNADYQVRARCYYCIPIVGPRSPRLSRAGRLDVPCWGSQKIYLAPVRENLHTKNGLARMGSFCFTHVPCAQYAFLRIPTYPC